MERDSMERVLGDLDAVFSFSEERRPQERAHEYLEAHGVARGVRDTAMQACARHLVERAGMLCAESAKAISEAQADMYQACVSCGIAADAIMRAASLEGVSE